MTEQNKKINMYGEFNILPGQEERTMGKNGKREQILYMCILPYVQPYNIIYMYGYLLDRYINVIMFKFKDTIENDQRR